MKRAALVLVAVVLAGIALFVRPVPADSPASDARRLQLVEATISDLQRAMRARALTSEELVQKYLLRVAAFDDAGPGLNSYIHVNAAALDEARARDLERRRSCARGPLHGIPVLLKDNINTDDMPTTAGSIALEGSLPPEDAFITKRLREAGAVLIGKATMTEYANFIAIGMPTGYSSLGRFGFNPYDPRPLPGGDGRPVLATGGSSSGSGISVSANLVTVAIGTETSGSILSPASSNGVVGIKPTVGLVSRSGILPITADQDTAGPIARTVTDAAILLGVIAGFDPDDLATLPCVVPGTCRRDYTRFLRRRALRGARIAVPTPAGRAVLVLPPGTAPGQVFRLRGQGLPRLSDEGTGDLFVAVRVEMPHGLDARTDELVRDLERLLPTAPRPDLARYQGGAE